MRPALSRLPRRTPYDTVIPMKEVLTIRVRKETRRRLERLARAENLTLSQSVRRALPGEGNQVRNAA